MGRYTRQSLRNLKDRLTEKVGNNSTFWSDAEKGDAINEAICVWQVMIGEFTTTFTFPATPMVFYPVPKQLGAVNRILFNGTPLTLISLSELDWGFPGWQGVTGTPVYWAPVGIDKFVLSPQPSSGSLKLEGYQETIRLISDGEFIQLGDEEMTRILDYAHHYLTFKEGFPELQASMSGFKRFVDAAATRNNRLLPLATYINLMGQVRDEQERPSQVPADVRGIRETT